MSRRYLGVTVAVFILLAGGMIFSLGIASAAATGQKGPERNSEGAAAGAPARLWIAHYAPFAPPGGTAVSVTLSSPTLGSVTLTDFDYGHDTDSYMEVPSGEAIQVEVTPAGAGSPAVSGAVTLDPATDNTVYVIGGANGWALELFQTVDDNSAPPAGLAKIRVGHFAPVSDTLEGTRVDLRLGVIPITTNVPYKGVTGYLNLPANTYSNLRITSPGGGTTYLNVPPVTLEPDGVYTILAIGDEISLPPQVQNQPLAVALLRRVPSAAPSILLTKTVGTAPGVCASSGSTWVTEGADVTYCYTVQNTGDVTLSLHDLDDSALGTLLDDAAVDLLPGATYEALSTVAMTASTVNTAMWTAFNAGPTDIAAASDTALVTVSPVGPAEPLACNGTPVAFETGLPADWELVDNTGGAGVNWTITSAAECGFPNNTNGSGEAACADSDAAGSGSPPYDTELRSNIFDLSSAGSATLNVAAYYRDLNTGSNDQFAIEVWDGFVWNAELIWDEDHEPEDIALSLNGYAGLSQVQVRFRYYGNGWDWYAQVDDVSLTCGPLQGAAISLAKTVGTDPATCAATDNIAVEPGTEVTYCYEVTNIGSVTLALHDLNDSELGILLDDLALDLGPGASAAITQSATINAATVNTATWTAFNVTGETASATDTATVTLVPRMPAISLAKTVGTDPGACAATDSILVAAGTEVTYCYEVTNTGNITLSLHDLVDSELGMLLDDFPLDLGPGASASITASATITMTTVNTGTWTAFNLPAQAAPARLGAESATASDTATVIVEPPTAVTLGGMESRSLGTPLGLLALAALATVALAAARRRSTSP